MYATQHPESLSRMVLDANVDSGEAWYAANLAQSRGIDRTLQAFFRYVGRYNRVFGLGKGRAAVERTYLRLRTRLDRRPIDGFGSSELADVVSITAYSSQLWPIVASALKPIETRGNVRRAQRLFGRPGRQADNAYASYLGTLCTDAPFPADLRTWLLDANANAKVAPLATWGNTWANLPCRTWPGEVGPAVEVDGSALEIPVLLAGTTGDAPTPFAGSLATRERFPTASLVAGVGGRDHGFSLQGNRCVDTVVARYLRFGTVPERLDGRRYDVGCEVPKPTLEFFFGPTFFRSAGESSSRRGTGGGREEIELTRAQQIQVLLDRAAIPGRG